MSNRIFLWRSLSRNTIFKKLCQFSLKKRIKCHYFRKLGWNETKWIWLTVRSFSATAEKKKMERFYCPLWSSQFKRFQNLVFTTQVRCQFFSSRLAPRTIRNCLVGWWIGHMERNEKKAKPTLWLKKLSSNQIKSMQVNQEGGVTFKILNSFSSVLYNKGGLVALLTIIAGL